MSALLQNLLTVAHAQVVGGPGTGTAKTPCDVGGNLAANGGGTFKSSYFKPLCPITSNMSIGALIDVVITYILYAAGILAVIYLLFAGIQYITAGGDDAKATTARKGIVNAIIGIVIIVLAFVIEKAAAGLFV